MNENRAGKYKNNLHGEMAYQSFCPSDLPPNPPLIIDNEIIDLLVLANKNMAILDNRAKFIPNIDSFVSMYVQKEAVLSSQIEGTQATLEDIFNPDLEKNVNLDIKDVVNYVKATNYAVNRLKSFPLCNRLILETHRILLNNSRGQEKNPGEFRRSQNWIGGYNSSLKNARYIPPALQDMKEALANLEKYIHQEDETNLLIKAALIHYQFETIHPFLDGNGRIGRLLIVLFLLEKKVIQTPAIYLSYYLKQNRIEYYDRMSAVRKSGDYEQWIKFFLKGVAVSCEDAIRTSENLIKLRNNNIQNIENAGFTKKTTQTVLKIYNYLEQHPIIDIGKTAQSLELSYNTVVSSVNRLINLKILEKQNENRRNKTFLYKDYLDILRVGTDPI